MICPNCGKEVISGRFCVYCGSETAPLSAAPKMKEPAETPVPAPAACEPDPLRGSSAKRSGRWPVIIPILLLTSAALAFAYLLVRTVELYSFYSDFYNRGGIGKMLLRIFLSNPLVWIQWIFPLAGAVLFFLRTKRKPFVTAVPYLVYSLFAILALVDRSIALKGYLNIGFIISCTFVFISTVLACIYAAGISLEIRRPVFAVVYTAAAAAYMTACFVQDCCIFKLDSEPLLLLAELAKYVSIRMAYACTFAACSIALFHRTRSLRQTE